MPPYKIYTNGKIFKFYTGFSFFIFIWISRLEKNESRLVRHETIHFRQQLEMLFIFHWMLYGLFYLIARVFGHGHWTAYRFNPFELEAFTNDADSSYLRGRKQFAWLTYIADYRKRLIQPKEKNLRKNKEGNGWSHF